MNEKPKINQSLILWIPAKRGQNDTILPVTVREVGHKYFTVATEGGRLRKFHVADWSRQYDSGKGENINANSPCSLHRLASEINDARDARILARDLFAEMSRPADWLQLPLAALREIDSIIGNIGKAKKS
jgi:hypothetical protein